MNKRTFGRTGFQVTELGFGAAVAAYTSAENQKTADLVNMLLDRGMNVIDTAASYPGSETFIGKHLSHRRKEYVLISKCGGKVEGVDAEAWTAEAVRGAVDRALRLMKTDAVDVMLLHSCDLATLKKGDVWNELVKARDAGKIRHAGYSGDNEAAVYAANLKDCAVIETSINIVDQKNIDMLLPLAAKNNIGIIAKRPIANAAWKDITQQPGMYQNYAKEYTNRFAKLGLSPGDLGFQSDAAWPEIAIRFTLSFPLVSTAIIGTTKHQNAEANLRYVEKGPLPKDAVEKIRAAFKKPKARGQDRPSSKLCIASLQNAYDTPPMSDVADSVVEGNIASPATATDYPDTTRLPLESADDSPSNLLRQLIWLSLPVLAEQILHMFVGLTDTYLANHVSLVTPGMTAEQIAAAKQECVHAGAAIGMISYLLWFVGLVAGAVGTGSTAIIARATGARHRRLANSICGQSIVLAVVLGLALGVFAYFAARPIIAMTDLPGRSAELAQRYMQMMSWALPFLMVIFVANACLRGAGDTLTPAVAMIVVDVVNIVLSYSLTYGALGLPAMGFEGIAIGTTVAYIVGGLMQLIVLLVGRGGIRLFVHRLRPHALHMNRLLRIGVPSGLEGSLQWIVNFVLMKFINGMDTTAASASAHNTAVRIESISFLAGFAFATGAATMVGQSLGMKRPTRAGRCAYLAFAVGGSLMGILGVFYVLFGDTFSQWLSEDARVIQLSTDSLYWAGFAQVGFGAAMIFGGSLRGAGDTLRVMLINLFSIVAIRLVGVIVLVKYFNAGLPAIWLLLSIELAIRGVLMYARFAHGGWKHVKV